MGLDPVRIRENIEHLGKTEAQTMLREWIVSSEDNFKRREALEVYISLDDGKNFRFYEQLFLTDEDEEIRNLAGLSLKQNYISDKRLLILLKFILEEQKQLEIKPNLFAIELLNSINKKRARKILREYLEKFFGIIVEKKIENKKLQVLKESIISNLDHNSPLSRELLEILINLRLAVYYEQGCGYNVKMMENFIVQLNCEGANISDISEIYDLDKLNRLIYLNLHRNKIKRVDNLSNLNELRSLNLSENNLQNIECESYDGLNNLIELDLASNQIKKIKPFTLENLTKLSLDRNLISEITNLNDLKSLEYLNLSHNHIERIKGLHTLVNLKSLNLSFNRISQIEGLESLQKLQNLYLSNNNIEKMSGLDTLSDLRVLTFANNKIEKIDNLDNLINLRKLELSYNKIHKINGLDYQVQLQELFLDHNLIKKLEGMDNLYNLIILFLQNNQIENFSLEDIRYLANLNFIYLNENPLNEESQAIYFKKVRFP